MASSANIGFVAQEQSAVSAGDSFVPFCIHGTATTNGSAGVFPMLDASGNAITMPRAGKLIGCTTIKTVHVGTTTIKTAKDGVATSATGGSFSALGGIGGNVQGNTWAANTVLADFDYAVGTALGLDFSAAATEAAEQTLWFRPA